MTYFLALKAPFHVVLVSFVYSFQIFVIGFRIFFLLLIVLIYNRKRLFFIIFKFTLNSKILFVERESKSPKHKLQTCFLQKV